jgi:hypothetical protein
VLYSAVAAHKLTGAPVWTMLVAPPGSMKTELLMALEGLPSVHFVDQVTPNTFISGFIDDGTFKNPTSASLLHRIGAEGILVCPDFSTVLSMHRERRGSILSDMRRIYDGRLRKEFGTAGALSERQWQGRITFLVAATPDVDRHYAIFQSLGERFIMVRWPRSGGIEAALSAMNQNKGVAEQELKQAVTALLNGVPRLEPTLDRTLQLKVANLTEFIVRARTQVAREGRDKDIVYVPEPEAATRLAQQLAQLAKGSALLDGRAIVGEDDYRVVQRAALDCIVTNRRAVITSLIAGADPKAKLPASTRFYVEEELEAQGLLQNRRLSPLATDLLKGAGLI